MNRDQGSGTPVPGTIRRLCAGVALLAALAATPGSADAGALRHALDRPDRPQPPRLTVGPTVGGAPDWSAFRFGFSGSILFRPDAAAQFLSPLYDWNTGLVLHGEYRDIAPDRNLLSADLVLRKYLGGGMRRGAVLFAGAGGGVALAGYPVAIAVADTSGAAAATDATRRGEQRYYTFLAEVGYERDLTDRVLLLWKMQWRSYVWSSRDYSNWSVHVQIGFPLPW